jgi:GntR family transcriptional regulator
MEARTMIRLVVDHHSPIPLHYQVQRQIREAIVSGRLAPGDALPPESDLATQAGIARGTIRQALDTLVREGMIERHRPRGTFVTVPPSRPAGRFLFEPAAAAPAPRTRLLKLETVTASADDAETLGLANGASVISISVLRLQDDRPIALDRSLVPADLLVGLKAADVRGEDLYTVMEQRYGIRVSRATEELQPEVFDAETAKQLGTPEGHAGFVVVRCTYAGETPVELRRSSFPSHQWRFRSDLGRSDMVRD